MSCRALPRLLRLLVMYYVVVSLTIGIVLAGGLLLRLFAGFFCVIAGLDTTWLAVIDTHPWAHWEISTPVALIFFLTQIHGWRRRL